MGTFVKHQPCDQCGSKDNCAVYEDGSTHCFGCGHTTQANGKTTQPVTKGGSNLISDLSFEDLPARNIKAETCKKYGYGIAEFQGSRYQVATYKNESGQPVGQKLRDSKKNFRWLGDAKASPLYGQHLFNTGKMLTITEGELDCLSMSQVFNNKWPAVSVPSGAQSAKKYIAANLDFCNNFDKIVLCFDQDNPGQEAAKECAELFEPGKCAIAQLPLKDPNEMLVAGKTKELISAIWDAKTFRPDGIVSSKDTWSIMTEVDSTESADYPWPELNIMTEGIRKGELVTVCAGSGIGKSLFCKEVAYSLLQKKHKVGYIALEESIKRTMQGLVSIHANKPLHLKSTLIDADELKNSWDAVANNDNLFLYDHFGSSDSDNLLNKIRYMSKSLGCDWIFLDHLSIVVSGIAEGDERRLIDNTITKLRTLVEETGISLVLVSHLKRMEGNKSHEDGQATSLAHLRGSASIAQLSDMVIGLERDQQSSTKDLTTVRVLKSRYNGQTGEAARLKYDSQTGRLLEADPLIETQQDQINFN